MMTKIFKILPILFWVGLFYSAPLVAKDSGQDQISLQQLTQSQFTYKLTLTVDFKMREKILKANGEEPGMFDKALSKLSSEIHAADVVDVVEKNQNKLKITSIMSPTTMVSLFVGDKKFKRESLSVLEKSGYRTSSYFEERGDGQRSTGLIDYKKMAANFYIGRKLERSEKITTDVSDMLNILYAGIRPDSKSQEFSFNSSKSLKKIQFTQAEWWDFTVNGVKYKARRYVKRTDKADPASFEIWIEETKKIPLRYQIGLNENYGVTMLMELQSFK
jgi:hypothetical protein